MTRYMRLVGAHDAATPAAAAAAPIHRLDWRRDGVDWPQREASAFIDAGGLRWHVQRYGEGPVVLLVHGTGAATHSWRGLGPLLAADHTVIAPDLPGHGFSAKGPARARTLPGMARALGALLTRLDCRPSLAVGHSAGAAILARMALDTLIAPQRLVSINGALLPFPGMGGPLFTTAAKLLAANPLSSAVFAARARRPAFVERLLERTGSRIDPIGFNLYARLARDPAHVRGALGMMADWDLRGLHAELAALPCRLLLLAGSRDHMVPPTDAERIAARVPGARAAVLEGLGHLAHEEAPARVLAAIREPAAGW